MATYNGEDYVEEQVRSILDQLGPLDELIAVDDVSLDGTVGVLTAIDDGRLRVIELTRHAGHVAAFAHAMSLSRGEVILLADQDDIWTPGRRKYLAELVQQHGVVVSSFRTFGSHVARPRDTLLEEGSVRALNGLIGILLGRKAYFGCTMGIRRDVKPLVLPIPRVVDAHDLWVAMCGLLGTGLYQAAGITVERRVHGTNLTTSRRRGLVRVTLSRAKMLLSILILVARKARADTR